MLLGLGIAMGVIGLTVLVVSGGFSGLMLLNNPFYKRNDLATVPLSRVLSAVVVAFSLVMSAPLAVAGWGILRWKPWARILGLMLAAVNMLLFPIGTGVGLYAIWVLNDEATEFLFERTLVGRR